MYFGEEGTDVYVGNRRVNRSVSSGTPCLLHCSVSF